MVDGLTRYNMNDDTYTTLTDTGESGFLMGYGMMPYYNDTVWAPYSNATYVRKYNIANNTWTKYSVNGSGSSVGVINSCIVINDMLYCFYMNGNSAKFICSESSISGYNVSPSRRLNINLNTIIREQITVDTTLSTQLDMYYVPITHFRTSSGKDVIVHFAGLPETGSYGFNSTTQTGYVIEDKTYDFENNTLIIYSTKGITGTYTTCIYRDNDVIHGKLYQQFGDVNLWDASNQVLLKNLTTYYGNDTDWIQIK